MRKICFYVLIVIIMFSANSSFAATKQDVINAINATYTVGDSTYRLPQNVINKGVDAINSKNLTSKQCDKILGMIGRAVAVAQRAGTTDITKVSKEDLDEGISILREATGAAKMDLGLSVPKTDSNNNSIDGTKNSSSTNNSELLNKGTYSGDKVSGEIASGEIINSDNYSGDDDFNIISLFLDSSGDSTKKIDQTVETHSTIAIVILVVILFLNIFIIYLLFRSKWNKIAKCILIIIFVILFLSTLCVLCVGLNYIEELKMIYKLYYMLK